MNKKRIIIYVPGIMNFPTDSDNWEGRAVTASQLAGIPAEKVLYFCTPWGRAFFQQERITRLMRTLERYLVDQWEVRLVGHSNGTDIILKALQQMGWPKVESLHLVSGACEADFVLNGLNRALRTNRVGRVSVYLGTRDGALPLARSWLGRLVGYGVLGLHGPQHVDALVAGQVTVVPWAGFGHSTCFDVGHFEDTMDYFLNAEWRVRSAELGKGNVQTSEGKP